MPTWKRLLAVAAAALLLATAACDVPAYSLHPLITEKAAVSEPALLGEWCEEEEGCAPDGMWKFEKRNDRSYKLTVSDGSDSIVYEVRLGSLSGYLFLDGQVEAVYVGDHNVDLALLLPVQVFGRIWIEDDSVRIRLLGNDWLKEAIKSGRVDLSYERLGEHDVLLTAKPEELQEFALRYAWDEEAFSQSIDLWRRR